MLTISSESTPFKKPKIVKISRQSQNINQDLINTIQNLKEENSQLKEALIELEKDSKEKDQSIEECQNIINKLKEEYTKVVKEFELMEKSYNELLEEESQRRLNNIEPKKAQSVISMINNNINNNEKVLYKQNVIMKKKILSCGEIKLKEENIKVKNKDESIENFGIQNMKFSTIIKEKDSIIEKQNLKIKELNDIIKNQTEKIKSLEYKEKIDIEEKNKLENKFLKDIFDIKNASFSFEDLTKNNEIKDDLILSNNLKTELMKTELYSSLIRENHFIIFLQKIFEKMNLSKIKNIYYHTFETKNKYANIIQENYLLKRTNQILYNNIQELKEKIIVNNSKLKNKCINLIDNININPDKFKTIKKNVFKIKNENRSYILKDEKNIGVNINDFDIIKKKGSILNSQRILNTLPLLNRTNIDKFKKNEFKRKSQDLSCVNNNQMLNNTKIDRIIDRKKKRIILDNNDELDIFIKNNSLELNPLMTEENKLKDKFNSTNISLTNKTPTQKNNYFNYNYNRKNNIFKIKNEINDIISKNIIKENLFNSIDDIKRVKTKYINISTDNLNNNLEQKNTLDRKYKRNDNIKCLKTETNKSKSNNVIFTSDFFVDLLFKINEGIFVKNEFNKYKHIYNLTSYENIYLTFKKTCNELKHTTDEINLKINKSHYLTGANFVNNKTNSFEKKEFLDDSFKAFNEKIIYLKKLEFEFMNMNEYVKNYLISQEATIQLMYKIGKRNIKFEHIDKLFNLFEDCLSYRINEMNENIKFIRKLLIKLFKNQINCLFLSLEFKFK